MLKILLLFAALTLNACGGESPTPTPTPTPTPNSQISFEDITIAAGIQHAGSSWGSAWGDFNGDGWLDIWAGNHGNAPQLYINQQDGTFQDMLSTIVPVFYYPGANDAHGSQWADIDNDGDQDLVELMGFGGGGGPPHIFINDGQFLHEQASSWGFTSHPGEGRTPLLFDWNNDGKLDLFFPTLIRSSHPNNKNSQIFTQGLNTFVDDTAAVGFTSLKTIQFGTISDVSNNGKMEFITSRHTLPNHVMDYSTLPFLDVALTSGIPTTERVSDIAVADFNGDLLPDIYVVRSSQRFDVQQHSVNTIEAGIPRGETEIGFSFHAGSGDITVSLYPGFKVNLNTIYIGSNGVNPSRDVFTLSPSDIQNHGIKPHLPQDSGLYVGFDLASQTWSMVRLGRVTFENLVVNTVSPISNLLTINDDPSLEIAPSDVLLMNSPTGFTDQTLISGIIEPSAGHIVAAGDFDNDMDVDIYISATGLVTNAENIIYENQGNGTFIKLASAGGAAGTTTLGRGDSVAIADYDNDGFLDIFTTNGQSKPPFDQDGPQQLFRNLGNSNHWLEIVLEGTSSNRDGIGASVLLTAGGITQLREQSGGMHFRTQNMQRLHFGLREHTTIEEIVIRWPSGIVQTLVDISADQILHVVEAP